MSDAEEALSPYYIGEKRIGLSVSAEYAATDLQAHSSVTIDVDASECDPDGLVLPLVLTVCGPSPQSYTRKVYDRTVPSKVIFRPIEGGSHLVTLSEYAHNKWFGSLRLQVKGPLLTRQRPV